MTRARSNAGVDLTSALAAKGDIAGETWTGTHDFTGATVSGAGSLALVATASPSGVSSVSIDNCFTSTYQSYLIVMELNRSTSTSILYRWRVSGADKTTATYNGQKWNVSGSTFSAVSAASSTYGQLSVANGSGEIFIRGILFRPSEAAVSISIADSLQISASFVGTATTSQTDSTAYDGITIFPLAGSISGTIRIYGYQN